MYIQKKTVLIMTVFKGTKFYELDEIRAQCGKESLLPLEDILSVKYVGLFNFWMSESEWEKTKTNVIVGFGLVSPVLITCLVDLFIMEVVTYLSSKFNF